MGDRLSTGVGDSPPGGPLTLETFGKVAAAVVVTAYLTGLVTASTYLYRSGVALGDPSALRARFVYTGTGILLLLVTSVGFFLLALGIVRGRHVQPGALRDRNSMPSLVAERRTGRIVKGAIVGLLPLVALVVLVGSVSDLQFSDGKLYGEAFALWIWAVVGGVAAIAAITVLFAPDRRDAAPALPRWIPVLGISIYGLVFLVGYATLVSSYLYAQVPEQFGGARPRHVRLFLSKEGRRIGQQVGLAGGISPTKEVTLIWEDKDFVDVRVDGTTVQLGRDLVLAAMPR